MAFEIWLAFFVASFVLVIIPGPTVLLTVSYALTQGRGPAVAIASGVALGDLIAMSASLAGLGAIILASASLFTALKWIGAAYLIWLGLRLWMDPPAPVEIDQNAVKKPVSTMFWHATAVTALNPKSIAFFIAFAPQFISTETALMPQFLVLVPTFVTLGFLNALAYGLMADSARRVVRRPTVLRVMGRIGGGALMAMGALTATLKHSS